MQGLPENGCDYARHILPQRYWNTLIEELKDTVVLFRKESVSLRFEKGLSPADLLNFDSPKEAMEDWCYGLLSLETTGIRLKRKLCSLGR